MTMEDPEDKTNGSATEKTAVEQNEEESESIKETRPDTVPERHPAEVSSGRPNTPVVILIDESEGDNLTEETVVEENEGESEPIEEPSSDTVPERHPAVVSSKRPSTPVVVLIDDSEGDNLIEETVVEENEGESEPIEEPSSDTMPERHPAVVSPKRTSTPVVVLIGDSEGDNPQEASSPQSPESPVKAEPAQQDIVVREESFFNQGSVTLKSRKRRRRVALVKEDTQERPMLPPNQYETILRRRAIRKRDDDVKAGASPISSGKTASVFGKKAESYEQKGVPNDDVVEAYDEEYGDISVGMKLNIIGGKVIVQRVNTLSDGRASPAQLTGLIHRGDVLLSIDGISLVNLPIDQLMEGLKPLSAPHHGDSYKRSLYLRFASGEGLKLLEKYETVEKPTADPNFAFSQYVTFVDQLSGVPMFEEMPMTNHSVEPPVIATAVETINTLPVTKAIMSTDQMISVNVAERRRMEQQKYLSEFFTWNEDFPTLLRASIMLLTHETGAMPMTLSQMLESGERAMVGAKTLFYGMEDIDRGKDTRSFKRWNSTLSLRSRASARRRYVMKNVIEHEAPVEEEELSDTGSAGSSMTGDVDEPTGDELLLKLAAHDEIWRHNVIDVLRSASKDIEEEEKKQEDSDASRETAPAGQSIEAAQSLESLFLGEKVSNMLTARKKSYSLPPEDVTSVLFDLMTNLTVTPDEISLKGSNHVALISPSTPFRKIKQATGDENFMFAAQFLVSEALPAWLKSFRPLPWEQRRVLWPSNRTTAVTSLAGASTYDLSDDGLTQDSASTGYPSPSRRKYRKDLRQQIEDLELDPESRAETCVLVTFYFTQEILPSLASSGNSLGANGVADSVGIEDAVEFVHIYGSYLWLHLSLVYAATVRADAVIENLLALSKHDPRHREVMKELSKASSLILYEPTMLSAILMRLHGIRKESKRDRRRDLMNICVSAYPDLSPWQVRKACIGAGNPSLKDMTATDEEFHDMYYEYLSLLLHPSEGHDAARQDVELVTEWCELSIQSLPRFDKVMEKDIEAKERDRRKNLYRVVSRTSSDRHFYCRDLLVLMKLSARSNEIDLALNLVDELLDDPVYTRDKAVLSDVLGNLQKIAKDALSLEDSLEHEINAQIVRKVFHLFQKMATNKSGVCRESIAVLTEFYSLLQRCRNGGPEPSEKELSFVNLLAHDASPVYALQTLALWAPNYPLASYLIPLLHILLQRGAHRGVTHELSGSLLRVRYARLLSQGKRSNSGGPSCESHTAETSVWRRMFDGSVAIEK